ncbi:MAG: BON domain-containing protein [Acidobacteriota bacterium]|jgi:osmotically-inducible protein OsmY|nr:BON domain-containing protein [Acidobacteriota bacterium]
MRLLSILFLCIVVVLPAFAQKQVPTDDDRIIDQVHIKLAGDPEVGRSSIEVEVHDGNVTLRGKVKKEKLRSKAEHLAKKVKGVKSVSNQLTVGE